MERSVSVFRLRGELSDGMFPDERFIELRDHNGRSFVLIVPADRVDAHGAIDVRIIDESGGVALVRLPGELLNAGRTLSVNRSELSEVV